jgi:N-acetylglucosamine-6-phosphate deacetylase
VPRPKTVVKIKSIGAIDIHFHGAFGIDLMTATPGQLDELAFRLGQSGVSAFCPTTLSVPFPQLREAVRRLGNWITSQSVARDPKNKTRTRAIPLGIHLEGPYIHPGACGAHPPDAIRPLQFDELEQLWEDSQHQLKILTIAPELLTPAQLRKLCAWARKRAVVLSLGHSRASEAQAEKAFDAGFQGITHAWNALAFHHRSAGPMGAALGRKDVSLELILDQVHVSPTLIRWTRALHTSGLLCYVSDCVPAAGTRGGAWHPFGHLKVRVEDGACRLPGGHLAGGGVLLPQAFARWVEKEALRMGAPIAQVLTQQLPHLTEHPLRYLGLSKKAAWLLENRSVEWTFERKNESAQVRVRALF